MAEEFQESEIIFAENGANKENDRYNFRGTSVSEQFQKDKLKKRRRKKKTRNSVPVNIPENPSFQNPWFQNSETELFEDEYYEDGEVVPPHMVLGRRVARKMAFSVSTGIGRTLKGRDLSEVRNTILRQTGFLEASPNI